MKEANHSASDRLLRSAGAIRTYGIIVTVIGAIVTPTGFLAGSEVLTTAFTGIGVLFLGIMMLVVASIVRGIYPISYNAECEIAEREANE